MTPRHKEPGPPSTRSQALHFQSGQVPGVSQDTPRVDKEELAHRVNFLHFMEEPLGVLLHHPASHERILLKALPDPCDGEEVSGRWTTPLPRGGFPPTLRFLYLMLESGKSMILVPAEILDFHDEGFRAALPKNGFLVSQRALRRYPCAGVEAEVSQNEFLARGHIADFSALSCRVRLAPEASHVVHAFDARKPLFLRIGSGEEICFEGECRCVRQHGDPKAREMVFAFEEPNRNVFDKATLRNPRQQPSPRSTVTFTHPLLKKRMQMEVFDISTAGFSVVELDDQCILFPGLVLPDLRFDEDGEDALRCMAQVIYSREEKGPARKSGLAIIDIDMESYTRLASRVVRVMNSYFHISGRADPKEMWDLLFSSGIISPQEYRGLQARRPRVKRTYEKLCADPPSLVRHFTYQKNQRVYAQLALIHAYPRAWLLQHHAARSDEQGKAAHEVLREAVYFLNDMRRFRFSNLQFTACYFPSEDPFAQEAFGRFAEKLARPDTCSMDLFSLHRFTTRGVERDLEKGWSLRKSTSKDLDALRAWYRAHGGGLTLEALGVIGDPSEAKSLWDQYAQNGLRRQINIHSLKQEGVVRAVLFHEHSDAGLALGGHLNGVKMWALDPEALSWQVVSSALARLLGRHKIQEAPLLCYPSAWVEKAEVDCEKEVRFWALDSRPGREGWDAFLEFMRRKFKVSFG